MSLSFVLRLALMGGAVFFLAKKFAVFFPAVSFKVWLSGFASATALFIASQFFSTTPNPAGRIVVIIGAYWIAALLYLFLSAVFVELLNLFLKLRPRVRGAAVLIIAVSCVLYGVINASVIRVKEISLPVAGLTKEIRAVQLSDIHLGNFRGAGYLERVVDKTIELSPDVIFNTGDMFDSKVHFTEDSGILKAFERFTVPHYFIHGNHDEYVGLEEVLRRMKNSGAIVLRNETARFGELQIIGLNNMRQDENTFDAHAKPGADTVKSVMPKLNIDESRPAIVLHHNPNGAQYMAARKIDVFLAGHTHAGQLFPVTLIAKAMFPYIKGRYTYNDMAIHVSEGLGTFFTPLRVGTQSEIILVKLTPVSG